MTQGHSNQNFYFQFEFLSKCLITLKFISMTLKTRKFKRNMTTDATRQYSETFPIPYWSKLQFTFGTVANSNRRSYLFISQYPRYWKFQIISPLPKLMLSRKGRQQQKWRATIKLEKNRPRLVWMQILLKLAGKNAPSGNQHADSDMTKCIVLIKRKKVHCSCMARSRASLSICR